VLEYARHLLNTASNIFDDIEHAIGTGRHRIRVGAIPSAVTLTAAVIARYNQAHDEHVEILLQDMPNDALLDALHSGKLDFCVGIKPPDSLSSQTLETVTLFEDELVLIVSAAIPCRRPRKCSGGRWRARRSCSSPRAAYGNSRRQH
jgi:DNA-binding transcriptional LysR family regulator